MLLDDAAQAYRNTLIAAGRRPATLQFYEFNHGLFRRWAHAHGIRDIADVDCTLVEAFFADLRTRTSRRTGGPWSEATLSSIHSALSALFRYCRRRRFIAGNPMEDVQRPQVPEASKPILLAEDVQRMLNACEAEPPRSRLWARAFVLFLWDTGCRFGELRQLTFEHVDLYSGTVLFDWHTVKTRSERVNRLSEGVLEALNRYIDEGRPTPCPGCEEHVFLSPGGGLLDHTVANALLQRLARRANLAQHVHCHLFRHSHITNRLALGLANEAVVGYDVGHRNRTTTAKYTHVAEAFKRTQFPGCGLGDLLQPKRGPGRPRRSAAPPARDRWGRRAG